MALLSASKLFEMSFQSQKHNLLSLRLAPPCSLLKKKRQPSFSTDPPAPPTSPSSSSSSSSSFATPAGRSLVELAAAWDALAPRLPAVASAAATASSSSPDSSSSGGPGPAAAARVILDALKLAVSRAPPRPVLPTTPGEQSCSGSISAADGTPAPLSSPPPPPAALAASAALGTASRLADLASRGLPLDADAIAAGIVADAAADGRLSVADAAARLGPGPAALLQDVLALRSLPRKADCYDDEAAAQLREEALALYDGRAAMVEVARRAAAMSMGNQNNGGEGSGDRNGNSDSAPAPPSSFSASSTLVSPAAARQIAALESLQLYGPLGHALGMGPVAAELEDACFQELFPSSYAETATWLRREAGAYRSALGAAAERLQRALDDHDARSGGELDRLAARLEVVVRTKSLFSTMKKLLRLDDLSAGGRERGALFDLLGMRVVVHPRDEGDGGGGGGGGRGAAAEAEEAEEGGEVEEAEGEEEETIVVFSSGGAAAAASFPPRSAESAATEPLPLPRPSSPSQAERDAIAACYLVRDVASALWPPVPGRSKDYIARPKPNGYASLHLTVRPFGGAEAAVVDLRGVGKDDSSGGGEEEDGSDGSGFETGSGYVTDGSVEASSASEEGPALELQIRTARMHASAEFGEVRLKVFPFFFLSGGGAEVFRGKTPKGSKKKTHSLALALFFRFFFTNRRLTRPTRAGSPESAPLPSRPGPRPRQPALPATGAAPPPRTTTTPRPPRAFLCSLFPLPLLLPFLCSRLPLFHFPLPTLLLRLPLRGIRGGRPPRHSSPTSTLTETERCRWRSWPRRSGTCPSRTTLRAPRSFVRSHGGSWRLPRRGPAGSVPRKRSKKRTVFLWMRFWK